MKTIVPPDQRDHALQRWRGGTAKVWLYHISLRTLALRIERRDEPTVLYIVGTSCEHISGPFVWRDATITIADERDPETGENICRVTDVAARFELRCSTAALAVGPAKELDQSFENFLGEAHEDG